MSYVGEPSHNICRNQVEDGRSSSNTEQQQEGDPRNMCEAADSMCKPADQEQNAEYQKLRWLHRGDEKEIIHGTTRI